MKELETFSTDDEEKCSLYVREEGHFGTLTELIYLFLSQFSSELNMNPFVYARILIDNQGQFRIKNVRSLTNALFQSRVYYMMTGSYLPVVLFCNMNICDHATACVYLPYENKETKVCVWNRIFIDSSGVSFNECIQDFSEFSAVETTSFFHYQFVLQHTQVRNDIEIHQIFFMKNIQKKYGTCSNWSLILAILLVINYNYLQDKLQRNPTFLTEWADHISTHSDKYMGQLIRVFVFMRKLFYTHFFNVAKRLQKSDISNENVLLNKYISDVLFLDDKPFMDDKPFLVDKPFLDDKSNTPEKTVFLRKVRNLIQGIMVDMERLFDFKKSQRRAESVKEPSAKRSDKRSDKRPSPSASKRRRQE
jgi:hypothetical protein